MQAGPVRPRLGSARLGMVTVRPCTATHRPRPNSRQQPLPACGATLPLTGPCPLCHSPLPTPAGMVELVDAADSKSAGGNTLRVRVSLPVPENKVERSSSTTLDLCYFSLSTPWGELHHPPHHVTNYWVNVIVLCPKSHDTILKRSKIPIRTILHWRQIF